MHIALQVRFTSIAQLQHKQINKQTQKYVWKRTHAHWTCYCHFWKISKIIELTCTGQELNVQVLLMFSLKRNWKLNSEYACNQVGNDVEILETESRWPYLCSSPGRQQCLSPFEGRPPRKPFLEPHQRLWTKWTCNERGCCPRMKAGSFWNSVSVIFSFNWDQNLDSHFWLESHFEWHSRPTYRNCEHVVVVVYWFSSDQHFWTKDKMTSEEDLKGTVGAKIESIQKDKVLTFFGEKSNCYLDVFEKSLNQIWFVSITELSQPISLENDFLIALIWPVWKNSPKKLKVWGLNGRTLRLPLKCPNPPAVWDLKIKDFESNQRFWERKFKKASTFSLRMIWRWVSINPHCFSLPLVLICGGGGFLTGCQLCKR